MLYVDYDINCTSVEYYAFVPFVLLVLVAFTIALPAVILFYLFNHRNDLYSTKTYQIIGWLYEPFVRGAEFWQVHDLLMKMILTGLLIFVPSTARAGAAILICVISVANLNYFQPHKHVMLFWLTQVSFITTALKYTIALQLTILNRDRNSTKKKNSLKILGTVLIGLDIFFLVCSALALICSLLLLRTRIKEIQRIEENGLTSKNGRLVKILPVQNNTNNRIERESSINVKVYTGPRSKIRGSWDNTGDSSNKPDTTTTSVEHKTLELNEIENHKLEIDQMHKEHEEHNTRLRKKTELRRKKSSIRVKDRVQARAALRQSKRLQETKIFQDLKTDPILKIINVMDLRVFGKDEDMVTQGEPASEFMVIMKGSASVFQNGTKIRCFGAWDVLGEGALIYEDHKRGATVTADTFTEVLVLTRQSYQELFIHGIIAHKTHERASKMSKSYNAQDAERLAASLGSIKKNQMEGEEKVVENEKNLVRTSYSQHESVAVVKTDFIPSELMTTQIQLRKKQTVIIHTQGGNGWAYGTNVTTGVKGWFPMDYVSHSC